MAINAAVDVYWTEPGGAHVPNTEEQFVVDMLVDIAMQSINNKRDAAVSLLKRCLTAEADFPSSESFSDLRSRMKLGVFSATAQESNAPPEQLPMEAAKTPELPATPEEQAWSEFFMGWLDKMSRKGVWQRRWFALSVHQQRLWYFKASLISFLVVVYTYVKNYQQEIDTLDFL
jgi:hypothetical protein